jgi:PAS domain S-box-containing protein
MTASVVPAASDRACKVITLIAVVFILASWAFAVFSAIADRRERIRAHVNEIANVADVLREQTREKLRVFDLGLLGLTTSLQPQYLYQPERRADVHFVLNARRESTPGVLQFFIINAQGIVTHSSQTLDPEPVDLSWRDEFPVLRDGDSKTSVTIPTLVGTVGEAKGKTVMAMARRFTNADGSFAGAIFATISLEDFSTVARSLNLGPGGSFGMLRTDGTMIMRIPPPPVTPVRSMGLPSPLQTKEVESLETDLITGPPKGPLLFADIIRNNASGVFESTTPESSPFNPANTVRFITFRRVPDMGVIIYLGTSKNEVLTPWRQNVLRAGVQQIALTLLVVFLVALARRNLQRSAATDANYLRTLDTLSAVAAKLMTIKDEQTLVTTAAHIVREIVPCNMAGVHFSLSAAHLIDTVHAFSFAGKYAAWNNYKAQVGGSPLTVGVRTTNQATRLSEAELNAHPWWSHMGEERKNHPPLRGWMAAPLIAQDGHNIGFIQLSDRVEGDFTATDEAVLMQFVRVLSIILENLRLMHEAQKSAHDAQEAAERAQAAAKEAQYTRDQITKVFSATTDAVVVMDSDLRYTFVNEAFCKMAGQPREAIIGKTILERIPHAKNVHDRLELCRNSGKRIVFENSFINYDGDQRWLEVQAFPMDDHVVASMRDVTERRAADQKLMAAQRMDAVGRLSGGLAHDFNNLLAVVMGNAELLSLTAKDPSQNRLANLIRSAAARGANIVSRLLAFARSRPLDPRPVDVIATVKGVEGLLARSIPSNIAVDIEGASDLWAASADVSQLENVLVNLVLNARDAMPDGGAVKIKASNITLDPATAAGLGINADEYVLLAVTDTGVGMAPDVIARAFEPFFTTKEVGKGSGLGLSMVYGFAQQSGGAVRLESAPGKGTTVELFLPRATGKSATAFSATALPYDPTGTERILVVEDDDMVREFVELMLRGLGYQVISHGTAEAALAEVSGGFQPQLLLTDVMLRGPISGPLLAEQIAKLSPFTRVLYMSGYAESILNQQNITIKGDVLSKPFRRHDLAVKIRAVLTQPPTLVEMSPVDKVHKST